MAPENAKMFKVLEAGVINAELLYEEAWNNFYSLHLIYKKKLKIEYNVFV
jgi:hypothetical protein